jgi:DNA-binding MurR/RpiR family transcriptional regulator
MDKPFRDRVKGVYSELSPSFQRLADYLLDHPYAAAFMTATELGRTLEVDTATVVRFAQRLDYPGFPELLDEIQAGVKRQLVRYFQPGETDREQRDAFRLAIQHDVANIEQFDLALDARSVARAVSMINEARRILVVGEGMFSEPLARMLANALGALYYSVSTLPIDTGSVANEFRTLSAKDLVMAVAVSPYCPDVAGIVQVASERGAQTIGLIGAQSWPIARALDIAITCPTHSASSIPSITVFSIAINALFQALLQNRRAEVLERFAEFEQTVRRLTEARAGFEFVRPDWAIEKATQTA